ncbi:MAG: type II secretion system F family protein [Candidatus Omnitrophica bacterium]|nr:type II secretion system F family protein [Candidatus Omnitrophota bacterium]MDD5310334.1 type II secretion system F family protein [Candidatus Omnitrophota bacterium]MDD5545879.1 type II secretion system F family protein [Candidatus Omnitrophota bacterium]
MARFFYRAKKGIGDVAEGYIEADTEYIAVSKLSQMGLYPLRVDRQEARGGEAGFAFMNRVGTRDMAVFTQQFSDLLGSGLTLINALGVLSDQIENKALKSALQDVIVQVKAGASLSGAFAKHPRIFSDFFVSMISAGEVGGVLEKILKRLSDHYEKEEDVKSKIQAAMAYPALVLSVGVLTVFVLLSFVIPRLTVIFSEFGQSLPLPTRILVGISDFFAQFWWLMVLAAAIIFFLVVRVNSTKQGKTQVDRFLLGLPLLGDFLKKVEVGRLCKSLATLLDNGVPILHSIEVISATATNEVLRQEFERIGKSIKDGLSFSGAIKNSPHFPAFVKNMISVGEEGGSLEVSLYRIGDSYEHYADRLIKIMTSLIEPLMILGMGAVVAFIVVAMLLPIFQLNLMVK